MEILVMSSGGTDTAIGQEEPIAYLATKVMGWRKREYTWIYKPYGIEPCKTCGSEEHSGHNFKWEKPLCTHCGQWQDVEDSDWNPLFDWNDWRQVEEKAMEDEYLWSQYIWNGDEAVELHKADLPTRVSALIAAHRDISAS